MADFEQNMNADDVTIELHQEFEKDGFKHRVYTANGVYREDVWESDLKAIRSLSVRQDDVFLVTYQRSGTTLTQRIMLALASNEPLRLEFVHFFVGNFTFFFLEAQGGLKIAEDAKSPRWIKTHYARQIAPSQLANGKMVFIYRNPKDTMVSSWQFYRQTPLSNFTPGGFGALTWEDHFERFVDGKNACGDWWSFHKDWFEYIYPNATNESIGEARPNVFVRSFEQILENKESFVRELAAFIDLPEPTEEVMSRVMNKSSVEEMKKEFNIGGQEQVRKGEKGKGKQEFTAEQREIVEKKTAEKLGVFAQLVKN